MSTEVTYLYEPNNGGVADLVKYLFHLIDVATQNHARLYIWINHPISRYLTVRPQYRITHPQLVGYYRLSSADKGHNFGCILEAHRKVILKPVDFYSYSVDFNLTNDLDFRTPGHGHVPILTDYIDFTYEIYQALSQIRPESEYVCVHYRLGDKSLEIVPDIWYCANDNRRRDDAQIVGDLRQIVKMTNSPVYFLSDNNQYKDMIHKIFPSLRVFHNEIINPSYTYKVSINTMEGIKNAIIEFLFLSRSREINALSYSGFSIMSSYIGSNKLVKWY